MYWLYKTRIVILFLFRITFIFVFLIIPSHNGRKVIIIVEISSIKKKNNQKLLLVYILYYIYILIVYIIIWFIRLLFECNFFDDFLIKTAVIKTLQKCTGYAREISICTGNLKNIHTYKIGICKREQRRSGCENRRVKHDFYTSKHRMKKIKISKKNNSWSSETVYQ